LIYSGENDYATFKLEFYIYGKGRWHLLWRDKNLRFAKKPDIMMSLGFRHSIVAQPIKVILMVS
jgi:hypothetical protein